MGRRAKCELMVRCCLGPEIDLVWSGDGAAVMATYGFEFSCGRAWGAQDVGGREACPHAPKAGGESSLPGAVVYMRELQEKKIWTPQPSAELALDCLGHRCPESGNNHRERCFPQNRKTSDLCVYVNLIVISKQVFGELEVAGECGPEYW